MPPEAPTTDVAPETSKHTLEELGQLLRRLHPNATMVPRPGLPQALQVKREAGGAFRIEVNPDHFSDETFSTVLAQALTQMEQLEFEGNLAGKSETKIKEAFSLYKKRAENPAHRLFYQTLFQIMALHRGAVHLPILRHHLSAIGKRAMSSLHLRKDNFPLHIQLLFGLMGMTEDLNSEVINSLDELRAGGFWGRLTHLHTPEEDRLRMLNDDFFPLYEYFLNKDLKEWRKKKPKTEPEESPEPSETVDPPEDEAEQDEAEQNTPDYNPRYDTPDGQEMEEAPEGSGYKLEVFPPLTGWYAVDRKNRFVEQGLIWESTAVHSPYATNTEFTEKKYTIGGRLAGSGTKPIPLPNGYALDKDSLQIISGNPPVILRDSNGNFFFRIKDRCEFSIDFYKEKKPVQAQMTPEDSQKIYQGALSPRAESAIQQAQQVASTRQKAEIIRDYVRKNHFYPPGGNSTDRFNQALQHQKQLKKGCTSGTEYIRTLDSASHLDCYSASTLLVGQGFFKAHSAADFKPLEEPEPVDQATLDGWRHGSTAVFRSDPSTPKLDTVAVALLDPFDKRQLQRPPHPLEAQVNNFKQVYNDVCTRKGIRPVPFDAHTLSSRRQQIIDGLKGHVQRSSMRNKAAVLALLDRILVPGMTDEKFIEEMIGTGSRGLLLMI